MSGYVLHPGAYDDLDQIRDSIARDDPAAADRLIDKMFDSIKTVSTFPYSGHVRTDLTSRPLRFQTVREYLIAYAPNDPLWIVAVLHGRRNPHVIASILRRRK